LFFNALTPVQGAVIPIPHRIAQLLTQGALGIALVAVLTINPRLRIRPNWFLGLYTLLAVSSLMMSVRLVGMGTAYRSVRLLVFIGILWLLTPWWGRRDMLLLRSHVRFLFLVVGSVIVGLLVSPGKAKANGRLNGTIWPIYTTQVAHFAAELVGLLVLLWLCRLISHRLVLAVGLPGLLVLVLTHTRTALLAMIMGLLVAGASLFLARRRVRRSFAALLLVGLIALPLSPIVVSWLARGETGQQVQNLTGRTKAWSAALAVQRPTSNVIFGSGLTNDSVSGSTTQSMNGLPIDSSWISIYQDQGLVGEALVSATLVLLLLLALFRARGPTQALTLFFVVYCLIAGINESGLGGASPYLLDLTVAASLMTLPSGRSSDVTFGLKLPRRPRGVTAPVVQRTRQPTPA
jgi:hypothetical protein